MDEVAIREFWGKAQPEHKKYHPVVYHSLDVAAVAQELMVQHPHSLNFLTQKYQMSAKELSGLAVFLISLHDLGKFSRAFQKLVPDFCPDFWKDDLQVNAPHWETSFALMTNGDIQLKILSCLGLVDGYAITPLLTSVAGHHGKPPETNTSLSKEIIGKQGIEAANIFCNEMIALFQPKVPPHFSAIRTEPLSHWLAGLTVAADWIGSNTDYFPYHDPVLNPQQYWQQVAWPNAKKAVQETGMIRAKANQSATIKSLFNYDNPHPMQRAVADLELSEDPSLIIIEDATGSGKTEAATLLALRMMQKGQSGGLYFALPTMATANGMFTRMAKDYLKMFERGEKPSLALAHGMRDFHEGFEKIRLPEKHKTYLSGEDSETSAQCASWIGDDRRKTFFAQVGVGTIDQALLAVLPSKFQSLRLWGLAGRILIVDEAHAYDAYMSEELERLLEFHAALGGSAIILSATLPAQKRKALANAFEKGLGIDENDFLQADTKTTYPLITMVSKQEACEIEDIPMAEHCCRTVHVDRVGSVEEAAAEIFAAAKKGAAVAWVRNAVDDAIEAVALLKSMGLKAQGLENVDLFHARYVMGERQNIEQEMVSLFGKDGDPEKRKGRVLVATQVIEQSLDLDFDLMVSDLAPIDLLIQRAGRLWRHTKERPINKRPVAGPRLVLLSPDPAEVNSDKWLEDLGHRGAFVYRNHALLWRTIYILMEKKGFTAPDDLRPMIEYVYSLEGVMPELLEGYDDLTYSEAMGDKTIASQNLLELAEGYSKEGSWLDETMVNTRLGEPTVKIRLARIEGDTLHPLFLYQGNDPYHYRSWVLSEISVRENWLQELTILPQWDEAITTVKQHWPRFQKEHMWVVPVGEDGVLHFDYRENQMQLVYNQNGLTRL